MGNILYIAQSKFLAQNTAPKIQKTLNKTDNVQLLDSVDQVIEGLQDNVSAVVVDVDARTIGINSDDIRKIFQATANGKPPVYAFTNNSNMNFSNLPKGLAGIIHSTLDGTTLLTPEAK